MVNGCGGEYNLDQLVFANSTGGCFIRIYCLTYVSVPAATLVTITRRELCRQHQAILHGIPVAKARLQHHLDLVQLVAYIL